jgi:hypothetical protein
MTGQIVSFQVIKREGRLWIVSGDQDIYTPPDHVRPHIRSRADLENIVRDLDDGLSRIEAVMRFETKMCERSQIARKSTAVPQAQRTQIARERRNDAAMMRDTQKANASQ